MSSNLPEVKRIAPLKNVMRFSTLIERVVNRDPDEPGLACFYGRSGLGKTKAAVFGANQTRATYVEIGQFTTAKSLLRSVLMELGIVQPRGSVADMVESAVNLMAADPRRPLIIDEAHWIAAKKFVDLLRELSDKSTAPVIMIGEETLPRQLEAFERVHNRMLDIVQAEPCDLVDVKHLAKALCPMIDFDEAYLQRCIDATRGNARRIVVNLARAKEHARSTGEKLITLDMLMPDGVPQSGTRRAA